MLAKLVPLPPFLFFLLKGDLPQSNIDTVIVFDFGGGTLDVSLLGVRSGKERQHDLASAFLRVSSV